MASTNAETLQSASDMAVVGGVMGAVAEGGVESGGVTKYTACHKMVADAWERPPQESGQDSLSAESTKKMMDLEKMGAANPSEEDTLKQMKSIFDLPENATTGDINKKLDDFSRKMVIESVGLCPEASDADVAKQLQEIIIDGNMKLVGKEGVAESFGLPKEAGRQEVRDAAGKDVLSRFGLGDKYSTIDDKSAPELSKKYYDSVTKQIKDRFELNF